ncbi:MAG: hypothetical protein ACI8WT_000697 [Clostridium sp.]|jgi:uncharacterized protein YcfL
MKSNFKKSILVLLTLVMLVGCTSIGDSISEEEAEQLVIENHTNNNGSPKIVSIEIKRNTYIVEWKNKENKEWGIDKVTKDGDVKMVEATIE